MPCLRPGLVVGRGGSAKYWFFGTFGAMFERNGTAKSRFLPFVAKLDHDDAGAVALCHELAVAAAQVEELLRDGNYLQALPLPTKRGPHRCEPLTSG